MSKDSLWRVSELILLLNISQKQNWFCFQTIFRQEVKKIRLLPAWKIWLSFTLNLIAFKIKTSKHELHFKLNFKINFTKLSTFTLEDAFVKDMKITCYNSKSHLLNKDKNFNKKHQEYLPTAEKTFIRFWWQWSSGRFSAITMRDCQKRLQDMKESNQNRIHPE